MFTSRVSRICPDNRLRLLFFSQLTGGVIVFGFEAANNRLRLSNLILHAMQGFNLFYIIYYSLILSQSSLVGVWAAFSNSAWWKRLLGWLLGIASIETLLSLGLNPWGYDLMAMRLSAAVSGVLLAVRLSGVRLCRFDDPGPASDPDGVSSSIGGLMLLILVAAIMLNGGRTGLILGFCLPTVWASLGREEPPRPIAVSFLALMGITAYTLISYEHNVMFIHKFNVCVIMLTYGLLIGSLLVVRSCGYRLTRLPQSGETGSLIHSLG